MIPLKPAPSPCGHITRRRCGGAVFRSKRSRQNVTGERYSVSGSHTSASHSAGELTPRGRGGILTDARTRSAIPALATAINFGAQMYEVTIAYGNENGDGVSSTLVDIDAPDAGFHTQTYWTIIRSVMLRFMEEEPAAVIDSIKIRSVPNRVIRP